MKIIGIILLLVLVLGMFTAIFGTLNNCLDEPSNEQGGEVPGGDNPDEGTDEPIYTTEYIYDGMLNLTSDYYTYETADETLLNSICVINDFSFDDIVSSLMWFNHYGSTAEKLAYSGDNYIQITLPCYEEGVYEFSLDIVWNGGAPYSNSLFMKNPGYLNLLHIFNLYQVDISAFNDGLFLCENGCKMTITITFDFLTHYMRVRFVNTSGEFVESVESFSLVTENSDDYPAVEGRNIELRYAIGAAGDVNTECRYIEFPRMTFRKLAEDSYVLPDSALEDSEGTEIEGEQVICTSDNWFLVGSTYKVDDTNSITSTFKLTDFLFSSDETVPSYLSELWYTGSEDGYYGDNVVDIHLPNYSNGIYVFRQDLICIGTGDFFYPTYLQVYLKSPGELNTTDLFAIKEKFVKLASLLNYDFKTSNGGKFTVEYIFNFDENVMNINLIDKNGKTYGISDISLEAYNGEYKNLPIVLRYHIPPDMYEVNPNNQALCFGSWSYSKLEGD